MKRKTIYISAIVMIMIMMCGYSDAEDLRKIANLQGYWKFSIGDDPEWKNPNFNDASWKDIRVPSTWESQGYNDYNGYAWYRKTFIIENINVQGPYYFVMGDVDDCDEVYLNGKKIGGTGSFPVHFISGVNTQRKYIIPEEILNKQGKNVIAVRVYDEYREGGIISGPVGLFIDEDKTYLDYSLAGSWKFHLGDNKQWKDPEFNDDNWRSIEVPAPWEDQGYSDYDGYAWYRKEFSFPSRLGNEDIYLSVGKIDDLDQVFLNGKMIGTVYDLEKNSEYRYKGYEHNARRIYHIPNEVVNRNGKNVISVRVYDGQQRGGIYEGPIGIMTYDNYKKYMSKYDNPRTFWDLLFDSILD